jgi:hypothetical protein
VLLVVFALCLSMFCLGCVESLPLPKGSEPCSSSSDLALCLSLAFDHLLEFFLLVVSFLFCFFFVTNHVCCECTHQGGDWGPCVVRGPADGRFLV